VDAVRCTDHGFTITSSAERFTHAIVAVSPHRAGALLDPHAELASIVQMINRLTYQPIYSDLSAVRP
jgi:predicted NAD/FAD-binding protein